MARVTILQQVDRKDLAGLLGRFVATELHLQVRTVGQTVEVRRGNGNWVPAVVAGMQALLASRRAA